VNGADSQIVRSRPRRRTGFAPALVVAVVGLLLAGCNGGTVDRHALEKDSEAVDSLACEGRLLARDVTEGESTSRFLRVHGGLLAQRASNFADALSERPTNAALEKDVRALARKADRVAGLLETLGRTWNERDRAGELERRLAAEGGCP
jgi:hypothetical protein